MNKAEWISAHERDLISRQGLGERSAGMLAPRVAATHERSKGPDASLWPLPDQPITFDTSDDEPA